ncbi:MAG: NYN domain-containing protein [Nocardioides sp.]
MDDLTAPLAVLIDADNTSAKYAGAVLDEAAKYGRPTVRRAYGDWSSERLKGWKVELNRRAIQPIQQFAYTTGKNSTDFSLVIDAMDLLYAGHLGGFVLVSSDSDFTRLATRLQESGKPVYGIGRQATPSAFQSACTQFIYLENIEETPNDPVPEPVTSDEPVAPDLRRLLTMAIGNTASENGWSGLGAVGQYLGRSNTAFDPRTYRHKRLSDLVKAQPYVEVRSSDGPTGPIWVRVQQQTKKSTAKKAAKKAQSG